MSKPIRPLTTDPAAMMREQWHEPERAFPPPPVPILSGLLEERAYEILEFIVGVYRISQHERIMGRGVGWADVQRWYDVGSSQEMRHRIYACIAFLVTEGYLREGPRDTITPPGVNSDSYIPTEKGYAIVDRRQARLLSRLWNTIEGNKLPALIVSALVVLMVTSATLALVSLLH
jgi:hypothetical protein